ncbi:hypothetical protein [Ralstonia pseudosolanacearum]|uniref:hypothetical protein n=1 Tax=Ralstonia pseudosolanacearum TaxID=1310165 RepID=UPI001FFBE936|nr:hypothetical protein [Ralstonia pseudosolanacearum]
MPPILLVDMKTRISEFRRDIDPQTLLAIWEHHDIGFFAAAAGIFTTDRFDTAI